MAFDRPTKTYLSLTKRDSPVISRTQSINIKELENLDKATLFSDILRKINANSEQLESLKCLNNI
jgi:hypothetical protein